MGLTTALFSGLSGMTANAQSITVTGNNIANVNTNSFKSSRITFETQISQTISNGSAPSGNLGGSNPSQIGLGTKVNSVIRNFSVGAINPTGVNTDIAIEGSGFFILNVNGSTRYTRDGSFQLDANYNLVKDGALVQGYGVDGNFSVVTGVLTNLRVPLGAMTLAEPTRTVRFTGNLNSAGDVATVGTVIRTNALTDTSTGLAATGTSLLDDLEDGSATDLFSVGDVITISGAKKGGASLPDHTFEIGAANTTGSDAFGLTVQDLMDFLDQVLGIDSLAEPGAGVTINGLGEIVVTGNSGTVNDLDVQNANLLVNVGGVSPSLPFNFTRDQDAAGESVRTTFVVFDSLGTPLRVDLSMVLEDKTNAGTTWRYYVQSEDDTDLDRVLGTGLIDFDTNGRVITATNPVFSIDRDATGAASPQAITMAFTGGDGAVSALASTTSQIAAISQDGSAIGTLDDFTITEDGTILGVFSNSLLRVLGQVVLAQFSNPQGLIEVGANLYNVSANSGAAQIVTPGTGGSGRTVGGAVELSNVDLSQEFINLISASTGFTAASRVVTTSDRLIQELLAAAR